MLLQTLLSIEQSYFFAHHTYTTDLGALGYPLDGSHHRYKVGFAAAGAYSDTDLLVAPLHQKTVQGEDFYDENVRGLDFAKLARAFCPSCDAGAAHFKAIAIGVPTLGIQDAWTIDESGKLESLTP